MKWKILSFLSAAAYIYVATSAGWTFLEAICGLLVWRAIGEIIASVDRQMRK